MKLLSESKAELILSPAAATLLREARQYDQADQPHPNFGHSDVILCETVKFHDDIEGDVKICNGDTGPWMELVIFEDGSELCCSEVNDVGFGEITVAYDGEQFTVDVQEPCPCESGHPERCPDVGTENWEKSR